MASDPTRERHAARSTACCCSTRHVGLSSNAALQRARRLYRAEKAGHTGTLDPLASGLLPICFGEATKFAHMLLEGDKTYAATVRLGVTTTTGDAEGDPVDERAGVVCRGATSKAHLPRFVGSIDAGSAAPCGAQVSAAATTTSTRERASTFLASPAR